MNDRELLELAAKAAGIVGSYYRDEDEDGAVSEGIYTVDENDCGYGWSPQIDDGQALRLAVKLNMLCDFGSHGCLVEAKEGKGPCTEVGDYRRAIVRAAAEIGKSL